MFDTDRALRLAMGEMRRALLRGPGGGRGGTAEKLNRRRFARNKTQAAVKAARRKPHADMPKPLLVARYKASPLLDGLLPARPIKWVKILARKRRPTLREIQLEQFSFIESPHETLAAFQAMAELECEDVSAHLHFQDDFCIDIAPYMVLAEVWPAMAPIFERGRMMPAVQKVIRAVGLHRPLGMTLKAATDENDIWAYPLQRRRPANSSRSQNLQLEPQKREKVADGLCDAIDQWLGENPFNQELTIAGRGWIATIVGELLDNAERHSQPETKDGNWSLAAFMARRVENGEEVFRCYLGFLSVGSTIAESLRTAAPRVRDQLRRYLAKHSDKPISPDTLSTLFALQDGITRDPEADAANRGGYGFQEVLELVSELGHSDKPGRGPRVTIISGSSCIQLRGPYVKGDRKSGPTSPRVLWCNPENTSNCPPDADFVFDLRQRFAGTVISVAFTLDPDYLNATVEPDGTSDA